MGVKGSGLKFYPIVEGEGFMFIYVSDAAIVRAELGLVIDVAHDALFAGGFGAAFGGGEDLSRAVAGST